MAVLDPYSTHQRTLVRCALAAAGSSVQILELGAGFYSTPLLAAIVEARGGTLVSIDRSRQFCERFRYLEKTPGVAIVWTPENRWDHEAIAEMIERPTWDLVLVDHAPAHERPAAIRAIAERTPFVVVHDTESAIYGWGDCFKRFRFRHDEKRHVPHTTVLSNVIDVEELLA